MALLHEILYQSEDLATVDFSKYVRRIVEHLFLSYGVDHRQIHLYTELDSVCLQLDDALPCALLISEVISNSLKHGFPNRREGEIHIRLRSETGSRVSLSLSDNGVGLPEQVDWTTTSSLGLRLVRVLAEQLHATLDVRSNGGTEVMLLFDARHRNTEAKGHANCGS